VIRSKNIILVGSRTWSRNGVASLTTNFTGTRSLLTSIIFLRIKEEIENMFDLSSRGKTRTSPHLRDELRLLLSLYKEENLHLFCAGQTLGHAAINRFDQGHDRLQTGKFDNFISTLTLSLIFRPINEPTTWISLTPKNRLGNVAIPKTVLTSRWLSVLTALVYISDKNHRNHASRRLHLQQHP
jgi:hypothetical protein